MIAAEALQPVLDKLASDAAQATERGLPAQYIPELATVDPCRFGISICLADGAQVSAGDVDLPFSIQSVS